MTNFSPIRDARPDLVNVRCHQHLLTFVNTVDLERDCTRSNSLNENAEGSALRETKRF
jgi:hypothetical protein